MRGKILVLLFLAWALACRKEIPTAGPLPNVLVEGIPFVRQKPDFCGEADVEMVLRFRGSTITQDQVFDLSDTDPAKGRGAFTKDLRLALERLGFNPGDTWFPVPKKNADPALADLFRALVADLARGIPSVVCMNTSGEKSTEHFILAIGYDALRDELIFHDPALEYGAYRRMPRATFFQRWPLKYESDTWTVIRMALAGDPKKSLPRAEGFPPSAYAQHILALRRKAPPEFALYLEKPFVLIGNLSERGVQLVGEHIHDLLAILRRDFFPRDPNSIIDVWLLKDDDSYRQVTRAITKDEASTPYGFYSPEDQALIMNINTGGGTLLHELVHPFMDANLPKCPPWFNEGLGSLFERSDRIDDHIVGLTNWRLPELQAAIRDRSLPTLAALLRYDRAGFYDGAHSLHYAMARYLVFALQQRGVLVDFFRRLREGFARDPSGERTLKQVLGITDLAKFQRQWEDEMSRLHE